MNLRAIGCNVGSAPVELREKLSFDADKHTRALAELTARVATSTQGLAL